MKVNRLTKIICIALCMLISALGVGCAPNDGERKDISYLYIGTYGGGYGDKWLEDLAVEFEEMYKEHSFEDGKKGVDVVIDSNKVTMTGGVLIDSITGMRDTLFFTNAFYYNDWLSRDLIEDITEAVSTPLTEYGDNESILDKMHKDSKDFYNNNNAYYAIPFCNDFIGFVYDVDLFKAKGLFMKADGKFTKNKADANIGKGPDGMTGVIDGIDYSIDDGLPATYDQFFSLLNQMLAVSGIQPWELSGKNVHYTNDMLRQLWVNNETTENIKAVYSMSGNATSLSEYDGGAFTPIDTTAITEDNAYILNKQKSRYQTLDFAKRLVSNASYHGDLTFSKTYMHTQAQESFLYSGLNSDMNSVAMLVEGTWWYNEADGIFNDLVAEKGVEASKSQREFAMLSMPRADETLTGTQNKVLLSTGTGCFISKSSSAVSKDIAKKFLRFAHTDTALQKFTVSTSIMRGFDYKLTPEQIQSLTPYAKNYYNYMINSELLYDTYTSKTGIYNSGTLKLDSFWNSQIDGLNTVPVATFKDNPSTTVADYYNGLYTYWESAWSGLRRA